MKQTILIIVILFLIFPILTYAWNDCPFGYVNAPYPGHCARYVDTDNDQICDHSQLSPEERAAGLKTTQTSTTQNNYYFWQIIVLILLFYGFIQYLVLLSKQTNVKWLKNITKLKVRRFLNYLLLISFLLSMLTGLFRLFHIFGWIEIDPKWVYWHVEFSIIFTVFALVHILERWRHFFNLFRK